MYHLVLRESIILCFLYSIRSSDTPLIKKQLLSENEYREYYDKYGSSFKVGMGYDGKELDLDKMNKELREELRISSSKHKVRALHHLEVVEAFRKSGNKPSWMILDVVPVTGRITSNGSIRWVVILLHLT